MEKHFEAHGTGHIKEIKLMNGFGFVEYDDPQDAMDVVPGESSHVHRFIVDAGVGGGTKMMFVIADP